MKNNACETRTLDELREKMMPYIVRPSGDFRDDLWGLAWYYHTAFLLGGSGNALFLEMIPLASDYMARLLENFVHRPAKEKTLEKWGLKIVDSPHGPYVDVIG